MADKEVHVRNGSGVGTGLIAGILLAAVVVLGLIFFYGGFDFGRDKDVNVNVETPKVDAPDVEAPKLDVPSPDEGQ